MAQKQATPVPVKPTHGALEADLTFLVDKHTPYLKKITGFRGDFAEARDFLL